MSIFILDAVLMFPKIISDINRSSRAVERFDICKKPKLDENDKVNQIEKIVWQRQLVKKRTRTT